jgi:hypothetical protein
MRNERERSEKKSRHLMNVAKADGLRAINAQKKQNEDTEQELLLYGKEQHKLNAELRETREEQERKAKLDASNARLEGLKAMSDIKKTQEEREREALADARVQAELAEKVDQMHVK